MTTWPVHGRISGPIVMIGFGSIGQGTLPLIERHFDYDRSRFVVIDPQEKHKELLDERGIRFIQQAVTEDNYRELLTRCSPPAAGRASASTSRWIRAPSTSWSCAARSTASTSTPSTSPGPASISTRARAGSRTNFALREITMAARRRNPGGTTAVSCCGANPGMVSWFVKQALVNVAGDLGFDLRRAQEPRGLGASGAASRREGHPHRRARHAARQVREAHGCLRQHLVGGRLRVRGPAAGRARLGHA